MATERPAGARDQSIPELMRQLADETTTLVKQELALARAEMTVKAKQSGIGIGAFGAAGIAALFALGALSACVIAALALAMPVWAAALIVAVIWAVVAGVLALIGRERLAKAMPPVPTQTEESVKEDVQWAKTQLR